MISTRFIDGSGPGDITGNLVGPDGYRAATHTGKLRSISESNGYEACFTRPQVRSDSRFVRGVTLIELMTVVAMVAALTAIAIPSYQGYSNEVKLGLGLKDMSVISERLGRFRAENNGSLPATLAQAYPNPPADPWGNPYSYLNIEDATNNELKKVRKDKNLHPLNTDYDLFSMGADGDTKVPLTANASRDDIIRADNGRYVGIAVDY